MTKVKKECKIRKSAKERPIREIIENWIIDKLRKKEIEIRKLLRSF